MLLYWCALKAFQDECKKPAPPQKLKLEATIDLNEDPKYTPSNAVTFEVVQRKFDVPIDVAGPGPFPGYTWKEVESKGYGVWIENHGDSGTPDEAPSSVVFYTRDDDADCSKVAQAVDQIQTETVISEMLKDIKAQTESCKIKNDADKVLNESSQSIAPSGPFSNSSPGNSGIGL